MLGLGFRVQSLSVSIAKLETSLVTVGVGFMSTAKLEKVLLSWRRCCWEALLGPS